MKVLIVDGSKQKRLDLVEALADLTNVVIQGAVGNVSSALQAVVDAQPDVVVTGMNLPDGDGAQLIERVRQLQRAPSFVVLASDTSDELRSRYLTAGADRYIEGDADLSEVQEAVATLGRRRPASGSIPPAETQRLLGRMTAGVVHDLNNYLAAMETTLALAQRRPDRAHELVADLRIGLDAMERLTASLTKYARGGSPAAERIELAPLVHDVVALARRVMSRDVEVDIEVHDDVRPIRGVRSELEQLVLNLVINASDAMPGGGTVKIIVRRATPAAVLVEVSDVAAAPAAVNANAPTSSRGKLGLGIVQSVVTRHQGALRVVPRPTGGTLVAVMLPTAAPNAAAG